MSQLEPHTLDALDSTACGLRVEFFRHRGRWAHRLWAIEQQASAALLESIEGDDSQAFPPSPALQQLAFQDVGPCQVALLVGMAGQNHWSVGVEPQPDNLALRLDVACRNQPGQVGRLGSAYRALAPWSWAGPEPTRWLQTRRGDVVYRLVPALVDQTNPLQLHQLDDGQLDLHIQVQQASRTQRWCYEFQRVMCRST